ncbi:unknown [Azospirillum sp. CAG:239]|nr:unknown [Azospirillum sp. CAG:239]
MPAKYFCIIVRVHCRNDFVLRQQGNVFFVEDQFINITVLGGKAGQFPPGFYIKPFAQRPDQAIAQIAAGEPDLQLSGCKGKQLAERFGDDAGSSPVRRQVEQSQRLFFEVGELTGVYSLCGHIIKDGFGKFCILAEIRSGQTVAVQNGMRRVIQSYIEFWICKRKAASARMLRRLINGYFRLRIFPPDKLRRL